MQRKHISQDELSRSFGIEPAAVQVAKKAMPWIGKVARMEADRVPKMMMFAYPKACGLSWRNRQKKGLQMEWGQRQVRATGGSYVVLTIRTR